MNTAVRRVMNVGVMVTTVVTAGFYARMMAPEPDDNTTAAFAQVDESLPRQAKSTGEQVYAATDPFYDVVRLNTDHVEDGDGPSASSIDLSRFDATDQRRSIRFRLYLNDITAPATDLYHQQVTLDLSYTRPGQADPAAVRMQWENTKAAASTVVLEGCVEGTHRVSVRPIERAKYDALALKFPKSCVADATSDLSVLPRTALIVDDTYLSTDEVAEPNRLLVASVQKPRPGTSGRPTSVPQAAYTGCVTSAVC